MLDFGTKLVQEIIEQKEMKIKHFIVYSEYIGNVENLFMVTPIGNFISVSFVKN